MPMWMLARKVMCNDILWQCTKTFSSCSLFCLFPIHFKGRNVNDGATIISSVFHEDVYQLECEIINLSTYLWKQKSMTKILKFDATCTVSYSQTNGIKNESMFWLYLISIFNHGNTKDEIQIIINWWALKMTDDLHV
jgi:hypothetical protein